MKPNIRLLLSALVWPIATVLAPSAAASPFTDSAVGVGSILGKSLGSSSNAAQSLDPEWLVGRHTPTGQLFQLPASVTPFDEMARLASGWAYSGSLTFGVIGGDANKRNADFEMYEDPANGVYVNTFNLEMRKPDGGYSINLTGGGAGRHDQYYGLEFGRANDWKLKLFFSETPRVYTTAYKSLWTGAGTGFLSLVPGLAPGGTASIPNDNANIAATVGGTPDITLSVMRKRMGARLDLNLTDTWKGYLGYTLEQRVGGRPLGMVWGGGGGSAPVETVEPVDYLTHDVLAGITHVDAANAFNLRFSASLFRNRIDTLTVQEPLRIPNAAGITTTPAAGAFTVGRFDLAPNNNAYNARAEYTRALPDFYRGSFNAVVSLGTWRQNDNLIPYTTVPNVTLANVLVLPGGDWNGLGALSRQTAAARIDTRLANLGLTLHPTDALSVKGAFRFYDADNKTNPFLAVNSKAVYIDNDPNTPGNQTGPLTRNGVSGVWGRLLNEGSGQSILMATSNAPAGDLPVESIPYAFKQYNFGPSADYQLGKTSSLNAAYDREMFDRDHRERKRTWEDKFKVGYVNRGLPGSTFRVSYAFGRRRGDEYVTDAPEDFVSGTVTPMPTAAGSTITSWVVHMNTGLRKFDLADRNQHVVNGRFDTMLRPDLDAGVSLQWTESNYPESAYGRTFQGQRSANFDLNYQPSPRRGIYGFYSFQQGRNNQASIASATGAGVIGQSTELGVVTPANAALIVPAPGGPIYPLINAWTAAMTDRNHVFGLGLRQEISIATLNVDYTYSIGHNAVHYAYAAGGAVTAALAPFAGDHMPDQVTDVNYLNASLTVPVTEKTSVRFLYRYQKENIRDWHYQNLEGTPVALGASGAAALPTAIILDGGPSDYNVNWFGVMLQIKF